jgi:hypothetical protein
MEWAKQTEDMFKTWADVQRRMWDDWLKGVQAFGPSGPAGPDQAWEQTLDTWEEAVKKTLDAQVQWTRLWSESFASVKGTPGEMAEWARQGQNMMKRWAETQRQLWVGWFEMVRKLRPSGFGWNWEKEGQRFHQAWQDTVQKTLDAQAEWARFSTVGQGADRTKP